MTLIVLNPSNVIARSLAMEAARRQALKNLGYDEDPVIKHQMEVQRRRSELLQQYHPEVYDAEQDYARQLLRRDEVNLTPQSSDNYLNSGNKYKKERQVVLKEGQGAVTYSNGDKYIGEFHNSKREGQGTLTFSNGDGSGSNL